MNDAPVPGLPDGGTPEDAAKDVDTSATGGLQDDVPWAMQIALRVEKADPPCDLEACEAAARACVTFLAEAEARANTDAPDKSWLTAVDAWRGVAIRKVVRRARGQRWLDAQHLPGITVTQGRAEARAFVPAPIRPLPPELAKMQVEGTDLPRDERSDERAGCDGQENSEGRALVTVRVSPLVEMTTGKTAAQCAHAAQRAWEAIAPAERHRWAADEYRLRVVRDTREHWESAPGRVSIIDAGFTELDGQHETTRANW